MKIRLLSSLATPNWDFAEGSVIDWLDEADAARMVDAGVAHAMSVSEAERFVQGRGHDIVQFDPRNGWKPNIGTTASRFPAGAFQG